VPDAAGDDPMRIIAREFLGIGTGIRVGVHRSRRFKGDGGHGDDRAFGKPPFEIVDLLQGAEGRVRLDVRRRPLVLW
jgi:hypothetical protein